MKRRALFLIAAGGLLLAGCRSTRRLEAVSGFEVERYLGKWHEAARFPHRFEKDLVYVTAEYSLDPAGTIRVVNRGYHPGKQAWEEAVGRARFKKDPETGWLEVSFFGPFFATYKILHLDADYREAIVTGPNYNYLWILTRDPAPEDADVERLIRMAGSFGFDTNRLERVEQPDQP